MTKSSPWADKPGLPPVEQLAAEGKVKEEYAIDPQVLTDLMLVLEKHKLSPYHGVANAAAFLAFAVDFIAASAKSEEQVKLLKSKTLDLVKHFMRID